MVAFVPYVLCVGLGTIFGFVVSILTFLHLQKQQKKNNSNETQKTAPSSGLSPHSEEFWEQVRKDYTHDFSKVRYMNAGGLGSVLKCAQEKVEETTKTLQQKTEHGHQLYDEARNAFAQYLNVKPTEITFVRNATEATSIVAAGLMDSLQPGDEVLFDAQAHPGGSVPWLNVFKRRGIVVKVFEIDPTSKENTLQRIKEQMSFKTKIVQVSHITAPTGMVLPVAEIAEMAAQYHAWFHIDGAQSAGQLNFDIPSTRCHSYAISCHKWMGSPLETGVLWISESFREYVLPTEVGAYSSNDFSFIPNRIEFVPNGERYEYGTRNPAGILGAAEAVKYQLAIGKSVIDQRCRYLGGVGRQLLSGIQGLTILSPMDPSLYCGILTFEMKPYKCADLFGILLSRYALRLRPVTEDGLDALRVSCAIFNLPEDLQVLANALKELVKPVALSRLNNIQQHQQHQGQQPVMQQRHPALYYK